MENKIILSLLKLYAKLLELHDGEPMKIKSINSAIFNLEKTTLTLSALKTEELEKLQGVGKSLASMIAEIINHNTFAQLQELVDKTPAGVMAMFEIKGIGPKKIRTIWKDLGVETVEDLLQCCKDNKVAPLKGFGEKTQEEIYDYLLFKEAAKGKFYYAQVEKLAFAIENKLKNLFGEEWVSLAGDMRRKVEIIEKLIYVVATDDFIKGFNEAIQIDGFIVDEILSSPYVIRGSIADGPLIEIKLVEKDCFGSRVYLNTAHPDHLNAEVGAGETFFHILKSTNFKTEEDIFEKIGWQYIEPELREGDFEIEASKNNTLCPLITDKDLKGIFHNHTTYSDGEHTLEEMALYCKELGYQYLGISDHSKSAYYANGLFEDKIAKQHKEIDELNARLAPFKIFKGIESDILADGSLDYDDFYLKSFDFIVASIHSGLKMDIDKATERLVKAIQNPYTTMLGHPTGRLLLKRAGYPIDHARVIDACAEYNVIIEINANPYRLDLDWRWVHYALDKGVTISINPDAHEKEGYFDMHYGVCVGRKGGLTPEKTFNAWDLERVEKYLAYRKRG